MGDPVASIAEVRTSIPACSRGRIFNLSLYRDGYGWNGENWCGGVGVPHGCFGRDAGGVFR